MRLVSEPVELIACWLANQVPGFVVGSTPYTAIGLRNGGDALIAAVVYDNFTAGVNVDTHIAIAHRHAITPHFLGEIFRYPFLQLGVRRITGRVAASNQASQRLCDRFGFTREGLMRQAMPDGGDMVLFGMLARDCKWLEVGKRGKK